jgi:hypothetical protein
MSQHETHIHVKDGITEQAVALAELARLQSINALGCVGFMCANHRELGGTCEAEGSASDVLGSVVAGAGWTGEPSDRPMAERFVVSGGRRVHTNYYCPDCSSARAGIRGGLAAAHRDAAAVRGQA